MALRYYANAPATTLGASCSSAATNIQVASVSGLPIQYPYTLIIDRGLATEEVVSVTAAAGTTLTVTRGYDSSTAFAHSLGASVVHGISAQDIREANTHINTNSNVHGLVTLVGATEVQTLTNKTLTSPTINDPTITYSGVSATGAWTSYTPTIASGWSMGTGGSITGRYMRIGKTVYFSAEAIVGSTGYSNSGTTFYFSLPVAARTSDAYLRPLPGGAAIWYTGSTSGQTWYPFITADGLKAEWYNTGHSAGNSSYISVSTSYRYYMAGFYEAA